MQLSLRHKFVDWLWRLGEPVTLKGDTDALLPQSFQEVKSVFERLHAVVCVPLVTKRGVVGLLVLGEKATGGGYTKEDLEILETLGNHSAIALQNLNLREQLLASKELESFYKLSSFIVHDLRNTVSILSMLLENARLGFDDPEFRPILLNSLNGTVCKMKGLLSKISTASSGHPTALQEVSVNDLIQSALGEIKVSAGIELTVELGSVPRISADAAQLKNVIVNLVLNAIEVMPHGGNLTIKTTSEESEGVQSIEFSPGDFIEITVQDDGTGMSEDFISNRLFKPFQSTKKNGLGIGLYHCKEIVESHGGRIWANSKPGIGSTFHVILPVKNTQPLEIDVMQDQVYA